MDNFLRLFGRAGVAMIIATLSACSTTASIDDLVECTEPRPEVCTMDYNPVCGLKNVSGYERWKTYSNACTACSDVTVVGYKEGACDTAK